MRFKDLKIGKKLGLISFIAVAFVVVITVLSIYCFSKLGRFYLRVKESAILDSVAIHEIRADFEKLLDDLRFSPLIIDANADDNFKQTIQELDRTLMKYNTSVYDYGSLTVKKDLWQNKENLKIIGEQVFVQHKKWFRLLKKLQETEIAIEDFYAANSERYTYTQKKILDNIVLASGKLYAETLAYVLAQYNGNEQQNSNHLIQKEKEIEIAENFLREYFISAKDRGFTATLETDIQQMLETSAGIVQLTRSISDSIKKAQRYEFEIMKTLDLFDTNRKNELAKFTANIASTIRNYKIILITLSTVFIVFTLSVFLYFSGLVVNSIETLVESTKIMAKGDLSHRTTKICNDEIGTLADSFNKMAVQLQKKSTYVFNLNKEVANRKKAEELLKVANQKMVSSNYKLMQATNKLEKANLELKDFVYIASHDLKEPLRKISSFGSLLKKSLEGRLSNEDLENMNFMIDGADRMNKMIEGLLAYSRVGTKEAPVEELDLNDVIVKLRQIELSKLLEETSAVIELPQPLPKVWANPAQISQLLQNLIANGIKYRSEDAGPKIVITAGSTPEGQIRINVKDNGIGIDEKYHNEIFKMFRRLHSRTEYEGAGIGLAICKKIVEKHNGQIGIDSEPHKGSTFWFTLPTHRMYEQDKEKSDFIKSYQT